MTAYTGEGREEKRENAFSIDLPWSNRDRCLLTVLKSKELANMKNKHPLKSSFLSMHRKCNRNSNYGVCERWHEFQSFVVDLGQRPNGYFLTRLGKDLDFSPDNCIWQSIVGREKTRRLGMLWEIPLACNRQQEYMVPNYIHDHPEGRSEEQGHRLI